MRKKIILIARCFFLFSVLAFSSCGSKKSNLSTAAFYKIPLHYLNTDASGRHNFVVYAAGQSADDCLANAKAEIIRQLLYKGFQQGIQLKPLLNDPQEISEFRPHESDFIRRIGNFGNVIVAHRYPSNKLSQSTAKHTSYTMSFNIGVNPGNLLHEIQIFKEKLK